MGLIEEVGSRSVFQPWGRFATRKLWAAVAISLLVSLPCVWHRDIEAGDLGSHTYNAWLAQLINRGEAPGLYFATQWSNVLADTALTWLGGVFGIRIAEKIVVYLSALLFFWGAFSLITVVTRRKPWFLVPAIGMIAYGYTFQMGFLNYYLSIGLAFWVIALFWQKGMTFAIFGVVLSGLTFSAHLVGFMWLVGTVVYIKLAKSKWAERLARGRWILPIAAFLAILLVHFCVQHLYRTIDTVGWHVYKFIGFDQLAIYGRRYRTLAVVAIVSSVLMVLPDAIRRRRDHQLWRAIRIPLELCAMAVFATAMLWADVMIPKYATGFTYIAPRLSSITAILGLCVLGFVEPRRWHAVVLSCCAFVFFAWIYQDTGRTSALESEVDSLVNTLPWGARVIQTIFPPMGSRVPITHILDRACIGRCFAYANYEPASRQFRIRAKAGNPLVTASSTDSEAMQQGSYVVRPEDLPMAQVYQCDQKDLTKLCIRDLVAGEPIGLGAYIAKY